MANSDRLDRILVERGLAATRSKAQALIMAGEVQVEGQRADKAGMAVPLDAVIEVREQMPYVSRGGIKLAGALDVFDVPVSAKVCADVGACTGGFTDVLLQRGAKRVYAIDVGYGQLDWKIRQDERVEVVERTNARYLEELPEPITLTVIDVSFISLKLVLPAVRGWLTRQADIIALVKPQFEAGREHVGKGGIVRQPVVHRRVLEELWNWTALNELDPVAVIRSPIEGSGGNVEFFIWMRPGRPQDVRPETVIADLF